MDMDMDILEETAAEERQAEFYAFFGLDDENDEDADFEDDDEFDDGFDLDVEYGFEEYEPSPYDGTYSEE